MGWFDDLLGTVGIKKTEKKDSAPKATPSSAKPADFDVRPPRAGSSGQPGSDLASLLSGGKPKEQGPIASPFAAQAKAKRQQETAAQAAAAEAANAKAKQEKAAAFVRQQAADQQAGPKTAVEQLKAPAPSQQSLIEQLQGLQLAAAAEILTAAQAAPEAPAAEQVRTAAQAAPAGQERRPAPVADDDEDDKSKPPSELDELALLLNMPLGSTTPPSSKPTGMIRTPGLEPGLAAKLEANVKVEPKKRPWWKLDENSTPIGGLGPGGHTATQVKEATKLKERQEKEKTGEAPGVDEALAGQAEVKDLTRKEYLALNPRARAAVDFNTLLVDAVSADLADGKTLDDDKLSEQKKYQHNVNKMFGKDYGSKVYAPRTMALLEEIDFKNRDKGTAKADLDEFLNLDRGVHEKDLKYAKEIDYQGMLTGKGAEDFKDQVVADRVTIQSQLVKGTEEMQKALINSGTFLDSFRNTALKELNAKVVDYGASEFDIKPAVGFGGTERDTSMSRLYDLLAGKDMTKKQIDTELSFLASEDIDSLQLPTGETITWKAKDYEKFFEYADRRTRNEIRLGRENPAEGERRSAAEMRKLLDLSK